MKSLTILVASGILAWSANSLAATENCPETLNFAVKRLASDEAINLCEAYLGKVVMVVNTASKCGYTPQYDGLEALYDKYKDRGLVILGFPSNDFGAQEPGSEKQIQEFCRLTFGVKFPMFAKTEVRADNASPMFRTLGKKANEFPQWNFHKYLIDKKGNLVASFASGIDPQSEKIVSEVERLLES